MFVEGVLGRDEAIFIVTMITRGDTSSRCYNQVGDCILNPPKMPPPLRYLSLSLLEDIRAAAAAVEVTASDEGFVGEEWRGRDCTGETLTSAPKPAPKLALGMERE